MTKTKSFTTSMLWPVIGFLALLSQACTIGLTPGEARPYESSGNTTTSPENTQAVLTLNKNGTLRITDAQGKPFRVCLVCSAAYVQEHRDDPRCDKLRKRIAELPKMGGKPNPPCPARYVQENADDPGCGKLWKRIAELSKKGGQPNICGGLTKATTNSIIPVAVVQTHLNPDCTFIASFGTEVGTIGSASYEALRQWLELYGWFLGLSPEQIQTILASPLGNCLH